MAAKDYTICEGMYGLYFAKMSKKNPHQMLADRRPITDSEILGIIHWFAKKGKHQTIYLEGKAVAELRLLEELED